MTQSACEIGVPWQGCFGRTAVRRGWPRVHQGKRGSGDGKRRSHGETMDNPQNKGPDALQGLTPSLGCCSQCGSCEWVRAVSGFGLPRHTDRNCGRLRLTGDRDEDPEVQGPCLKSHGRGKAESAEPQVFLASGLAHLPLCQADGVTSLLSAWVPCDRDPREAHPPRRPLSLPHRWWLSGLHKPLM